MLLVSVARCLEQYLFKPLISKPVQNHLTWLSTSLFCSRNEWKRVLNDGIDPLLKTDICGRCLHAYLLEFNYLGGDNVRFSMLGKEDDHVSLIDHIEHFFRSTYCKPDGHSHEKAQISVGKVSVLPVSIRQYHLRYPVESENDLDRYLIPVHLSKLILAVLKEEDIDDETLLTFAYHLSMGLISALREISCEVLIDLVPLYDFGSYANADSRDAMFIESFEENKTMLFEIALDAITRTRQLSIWMLEWISFLEGEIGRKEAALSKTEHAVRFHNKVLFYIHKQLCLNERKSLALTYFTKRSLEYIVENNL